MQNLGGGVFPKKAFNHLLVNGGLLSGTFMKISTAISDKCIIEMNTKRSSHLTDRFLAILYSLENKTTKRREEYGNTAEE